MGFSRQKGTYVQVSRRWREMEDPVLDHTEKKEITSLMKQAKAFQSTVAETVGCLTK